MSRFLAGFGCASLLWALGIAAYAGGLLDSTLGSFRSAETENQNTPLQPAEPRAKRKRRSRNKQRATRPKRRGPSPVVTSGDALGGSEPRHLHAESQGGEEQLTGYEIEQGFDSAMPRIRRCLILVAADEPVTGKLIFGLRVTGASGVTKVNLRGPSAITRGEAGSCLRTAARGIRFRSFDGPDMVVHFPLMLD